MYRYNQTLPGGAITLVGVLGLSYLMPGWVAGLLGLGATHSSLFVWLARQEGIALILFWLVYGAVGFGMLVAAAIGAFAAAVAMMRGLAVVKAWGVRAGQAIAGLLGEFLYWPVQLLSELLWDSFQQRRERLYLFLQEQYELRRMYSEEYANDYPSFRAFQRAYYAHQHGQPATETDPLQRAIKLLGLPQRFTKDDVKRRFNQLIAVLHPDKIGPNEFAPQVIDAYKLICSRKAWQ
jgi:hypothetical protein